MKLEHVAIWTDNLERLKEYYIKYFGAVPGDKYLNSSNGFSSYFLVFGTGARLEIMFMANIPSNLNDTVYRQHKGIIHLAFAADSIAAVEKKAAELQEDGFPILKGPRLTGDGYYEFETLDPDSNRIEVTFRTLEF